MEPKTEGLEDDFPFQTGDFQVNHVNFSGVYHDKQPIHTAPSEATNLEVAFRDKPTSVNVRDL